MCKNEKRSQKGQSISLLIDQKFLLMMDHDFLDKREYFLFDISEI